MGLQTLIILLSVIGFVPDQGSANIPIQKYGLVQGQYLIAQDLDELFPKSKSYSFPVSAPITKSVKPHGAGFHLSASLGFCDLVYLLDYAEPSNQGLTYKLSADSWFSERVGFGFEVGFFNIFKPDIRERNPYEYDEWNIYFSPYLKIGLLSGPDWRLFFDLGLGYDKAKYIGNWNSSYWTDRFFLKFSLGWSILVSKNIEAGILIDNKYMVVPPDSGIELGGISLFLFSISPFIGYVF